MQLSNRRPVRAILRAGLIAFAAWPMFAISAERPGQTVIGQWKLISVLDSTNIASMDENEAGKMLGHIFTIRKEGAEFERRVCRKPDFETEQVEPNLYLKKTDPYVSASSLTLPNPVTVVDISCTSVFIKNKNRLVIFWKGFYFEAMRVRR